MDRARRLRHPDAMGNSATGLPATASLELRLGALLARAGLVPREKLEEALGLQATRDARLGELLVEMGLIDRLELNAILGLQDDLRTDPALSGVAVPERLRLGRLLLDAGVIDERTLEQALARQAEGDATRRRRLGETLVESGAITGQTLNDFLQRQRRLLAVAMAGLAVLGAVVPEAEAAGTHQVNIQATVLRHATISELRAPQSVTVTALDIERGYVEVDEPVEVAVRTNHPAGVVLDFAVNSPFLSAVDVQASDGGEVRGRSVFVPQRSRGLRTQQVLLKVRLQLAPGTPPGTIANPFAVSLTPL